MNPSQNVDLIFQSLLIFLMTIFLVIVGWVLINVLKVLFKKVSGQRMTWEEEDVFEIISFTFFTVLFVVVVVSAIYGTLSYTGWRLV